MVGTPARDDAKLAASKVMAESVGQLLDIRGLPISGWKPELFTHFSYGAKFSFDNSGEFATGRKISLIYYPNVNNVHLSFDWPSYVDVDGSDRSVEPGYNPADYSPNGELWSDKQPALFQSIVDAWDFSVVRDLNRKEWRDVCNPNKKTPLTDVTIASKKIESLWKMYDLLYRASSFWSQTYLRKGVEVKEFIAKLSTTLGKPSFSKSYGDTVSLEFKTSTLGEVSMQVNRDEDGINTLDSIGLKRDDFLKLINYIAKFGTNGK
jgi:hypothetical protein